MRSTVEDSNTLLPSANAPKQPPSEASSSGPVPVGGIGMRAFDREWFRQALLERGVTYAELSKLAGVSFSTVAAAGRGKPVTTRCRYAILKALKDIPVLNEDALDQSRLPKAASPQIQSPQIQPEDARVAARERRALDLRARRHASR